MKILKNKWFIIALIVVAVAAAAAFTLRGKENVQYFTAKVERGDVRDVVEATGTINAVTTVQVGSQVSGTIQSLTADFNSRVKKNQVVARIDPTLFQGNLSQAQADYENARANLAVSQANLAKSRAAEVQTKSDYERSQGLAKEGVISQQQLDLARPTPTPPLPKSAPLEPPSRKPPLRFSSAKPQSTSPRPISITPSSSLPSTAPSSIAASMSDKP